MKVKMLIRLAAVSGVGCCPLGHLMPAGQETRRPPKASWRRMTVKDQTSPVGGATNVTPWLAAGSVRRKTLATWQLKAQTPAVLSRVSEYPPSRGLLAKAM